MCECNFGQCASGLLYTTPEGASDPVVMCEWKCASASLVNMGVVRPVFTTQDNVGVVSFLQYQNVRVLVWSMYEWSSCYNTKMCVC